MSLPSIREALRFRQDQYGWSQKKMAAALGIQASHYSEILSGKRNLSLKAVKRAYAIGVPASVLLRQRKQ